MKSCKARGWSFLAKAFVIALLGSCAAGPGTIPARSAAPPGVPIVTEEFMVPGADPGISLYVRNKRLASTSSFAAENVVLFVHGATYPSETGFDLRLDGVSWMDVLATQGYDVYLVDIRGYGRSTRPPEHVSRLVLYAPVWLRNTKSLTDAGGELGAYRQVTIEQARKRKETGLVPGRKPQPDAWFEAWARETFESDPVGSKANPKFVRAPNGVVQDGRLYWSAGKPVWDPALVKVPTLLILAEWDADTPPYMAQTLFPLLKNASPKKLVILSEGTHSIMNETQRFSLFDEVRHFLDDGRPR